MDKRIVIMPDIISRMLKFVSKDDRYGKSGICIHPEDRSKVIIEATNVHRLHRECHDVSGIPFPDTAQIISEYGQKNAILSLAEEEVRDMIFKLKEMKAVSNARNDRASYILRMKFTQTRICMILHKRSIIRHLTPSAGIPDSFVGKAIGFNVNYLYEALEIFKEKDIDILIGLPHDPVIFKPTGEEYPMHVLMPMNIEGIE